MENSVRVAPGWWRGGRPILGPRSYFAEICGTQDLLRGIALEGQSLGPGQMRKRL